MDSFIELFLLAAVFFSSRIPICFLLKYNMSFFFGRVSTSLLALLLFVKKKSEQRIFEGKALHRMNMCVSLISCLTLTSHLSLCLSVLICKMRLQCYLSPRVAVWIIWLRRNSAWRLASDQSAIEPSLLVSSWLHWAGRDSRPYLTGGTRLQGAEVTTLGHTTAKGQGLLQVPVPLPKVIYPGHSLGAL